ncbi:MAG: glycosyltransferase family 2 protein [Acidobacteriota bacterium]|nr:glycosyltransferase family 2 protein [Acidobacteriota bacterium]
MPVISAVVVSYRSAALAVRAFESMRRDAAGSGLALETIAVVNSGDEEEARALEGAAERVLLPDRNLGFAGGLNAGLLAASGEVLVLSNPDVVLRPGALQALRAAVASDFVAAGPAFFLDEGETLHMPPGEEPGLSALARRRLGARGSTAVFRRAVRRAQRAAREAERGETAAVTALSGALVAVSRRTLESVGPFDEGYALYYEENDWQRRLRTLGGSLRRVGAARVVHAYNRSARVEPRATAWFAESERRYFTTHFGARGAVALDALASEAARTGPPAPLADGVLRLMSPAAIALSPLADFGSFAFVPRAPTGAWRPPDDVRSGFGSATWYARAVDPETLAVLAQGAIS